MNKITQFVKDSRPWYAKGKVICLADSFHGVSFRHPVRPYTGSPWDEGLICNLLAQGHVVVIVDYGFKFYVPDSYNDIPHVGSQLKLF